MKKTVKKARSTTTRKRLITPEDLLRFQTLSDTQVSPDGGHVIFTHKVVSEKNAYHTNLWIVPTNAKGRGAQPRAFTSGNRDSRGRWSPDGRTVAFISARESKAKPQIYLMPATGGEARKLTNFPEGSISGYRWSPDGTMLAVRFREQAAEWTEDAKKQREQKGLTTPARVIDDWWYRLDGDGYFGAQRFHLYIVDVATGAHRVIYNKDTLGFFDFDFSPDSKYIALTSNRDPKAMVKPWATELLRLNVATGSVTRIPNVPQGTKSAVRWSPDGRLIAWAGREGVDDTYSTENLHLYVCDARTGRTRNLTGKEDYCLLAAALSDTADAAFEANIQWSRDSKRIFMQLGWHGETHVASIPAKGGEITMHTAGPYAHQMGNLSSDGSLIALTRGSATALDEVHITRTDKARFNPTRLTNLNGPLLSTLKLSVPQDHWIEAADGTRVHVWTMNPANYSPRQKHPAVLEIHGGPHAQYGVGFFHEFQVLAAAGYMVVYSNPRGSKGYGRDHCAAIRGAWGGNDWADIQAVIRFMRHRKDINPRKMGVMGGSYGGYMTNWVIGHTNVFAGAITDRCVSNLVSMFGNSDFTDEPDRYWPGNSWDRIEARWEQSPLKHLGNAKTPTLIIHSEGDLRCNIEQAEQVFTALKLNNVPTRFVRYPRETSHGFSRGGPPDLRLHRLGQILAWWARWLRSRR